MKIDPKTDAKAVPALAKEVADIIRRFEPTAEVILYGSRARGDAEPDSDWDFLVLLDEEPDSEEEDRIRSAVYHLEIERDEIFTLIIRNRETWDDPLTRSSPFFINVRREGFLV